MINTIQITNLNLPELAIYAQTSESQLLHYNEPEPGIFIAESPKVIERAIHAGYEPISILTTNEHQNEEAMLLLEMCKGIPVYSASHEVLKQITGFALTRGMLCAMRRKRLPQLEEICANTKRIVVLEEIVNPTNIGAIFRSAAALNMDAVLLTNGCSDPLYRRAIRVSMGTIFQIPWTILEKKCIWPQEGMGRLQKMGFKTVAMALKEDSMNIDDHRLKVEEKLAVVLGTEGEGLGSQTIADCDFTVCIPMTHGVDSLNVAAASAVAFWELGNE